MLISGVPERSRTETTYFYERLRAPSAGIIESAGTTFLLLIAVRWFHAGPLAKAMVAAGGSMGFFVAPLVVTFVERRGWKTSSAASRMAMVGAVILLVAALIPQLPVFVFGSVVGMMMSSACVPLMTQIYQENYPANERGRLFSKTMILRIGATALFSDWLGRLLTGRIQYFQWLLLFLAATFVWSAFCLKRCPSTPLVSAGGEHPLRALRYAREDRIFRLTLISWMFLGFGTLMMQPLRVEYLANPKYGVTLFGEPLDEGSIAVLAAVIPNMVRLVLSPVWGWLFDRMNFFLLRVTLNLGFALGIMTFFMSNSLTGLIVGAVIYGISNAGGDVAWGLWVTKFAPPQRVADYMSVHTFFTGGRGILAPVIAFYLAGRNVPMPVLGWISAGLIGCAILLLLPEVKFDVVPSRAVPSIEKPTE